MISSKMILELNGQLNFELYSGYLYLSMSADFKVTGFNGFANWMHVQTQEETVHAMGFYHYLLSRGARVALQKIDQPKSKWKSPLEAFNEAYKHECIVSSRIHELAKLAASESDFATSNFLQWYVNEQIEEEANTLEITNQLKIISSSKEGLFMLDRELAARQFIMAAIPGGMPVASGA